MNEQEKIIEAKKMSIAILDTLPLTIDVGVTLAAFMLATGTLINSTMHESMREKALTDCIGNLEMIRDNTKKNNRPKK